MAGEFGTTSWSTVAAARDPDRATAEKALNRLCARYWRPLYVYFRHRGHSQEDAADLTQELFTQLLERGFPAQLSRSGGRLRSFLLACAENLTRDMWEKQTTKKRGAGSAILPLDLLEGEASMFEGVSASSDPRERFDRVWAETLLANVLKRVEHELEATGRQALFQYLRDFLATGTSEEEYETVGVTLGISEGAVRVAVHRLRRRFGKLLREEVGETVECPEDLDAELHYLVEMVTK